MLKLSSVWLPSFLIMAKVKYEKKVYLLPSLLRVG